jgi:hypothetical protein
MWKKHISKFNIRQTIRDDFTILATNFLEVFIF